MWRLWRGRVFSTSSPKRPVSVQSSETWAPSLKVSLSLAAAAFTGLSSYSAYKVGYCRESVFLPFFPVSRQRAPLWSEVDKEAVINEVKKKLQDRLAVDEEVHFLLGVPISVADDERNKFTFTIRSSEPGIAGVTVDPSWNVTMTARPFQSSTGIDRLLQPFLPGEADSEDAAANPRNRRPPKAPYNEAVVDGKVYLQAPKCPKDAEAALVFRVIKPQDHPTAPPKLITAILVMTDTQGKEILTRKVY